MRVVYADDRLVVVDKPPGLLSVPGRTEPDCASARVQALYPDALVVHRLDQATSGLLLFARGAQAQRELSADFAERRVGKVYVAVVAGRLEGEGVIDLPLGADWPNRPRQQVDFKRGKPSQTRWRVLAHEGPDTRLLLTPVTGRSHQLRVHLAHVGHPILGDALYAPPAVAAAGPRLLLHASELRVSGNYFTSPPEF
jgi:tRNA pseudouridine32 synthase/23S rRNA pseudouridine746 synthase